MKKLLFLFSFLFCLSVYGQQGTFNYVRSYYGLVVGSQTQNQSAIVDVQGTNGGFLCPRLTTTQRNAIVSPAEGLMVYNTSTSAFNYYNGSTWTAVGSAGSVTSVAMTVPSFLSIAGSPVTTSGTLAVSLSGTALPVANGGTGLTSYAIGDIIYASGSTTLSKLPIGTASQQLRVNAGATALEYFTPASGGISVGTTTTATGAVTSVTGSILMDIGGVVTESASYRAAQATPFGTAFGFGTGGTTGVGVGNTTIGYESGKNISNHALAYNNTFLGYRSGYTYTIGGLEGGRNTALGYEAYYTSSSGGNVAVGYRALYGSAVGDGNVAVGRKAGEGGKMTNCIAIGDLAMQNMTSATTSGIGIGYYALTQSVGTKNIGIGYFAGYNLGAGQRNVFIHNINSPSMSGGSYNVVIGDEAGYSGSFSSSIAIGANAQITASNQGILGANNANGYISNWYFNGVTHTAPYSVVLNGSGGSGSNVAGASITNAAGKGTGTGASGDVKHQTSVPVASGTTLQTLGDRVNVIGKYTTLTESSATSFVRINVPTSTVSGGVITYSIEANDGADFQCLSGELLYDIVNKAGTLTISVTDYPNTLAAASTGTLTTTCTMVDAGSGNAEAQINAVSSLTQTVLRVNAQVAKNFGTGTITGL